MKAVIISFTSCGCALGKKLYAELKDLGWEAKTYIKSKYAPDDTEAVTVRDSLHSWMEEHWKGSDAVIFVGATGIAVRTIAPFVKSKKTDPAVLCMDEQGNYCIPLLSGHLGGANALAQQICGRTGALAVVTTATDLNDCFAIDLFAKEQGQEIRDMKQAKEISAALLSGKQIVTVGVGCRKGTSYEEVSHAVLTVCEKNRIPLRCLKQMVSIDLKKEETGIIETARELKIPFVTYSAEQLMEVPGEYTASLFVKSVTGIDNVCERSAVLGSGYGALIQKKLAVGPVTVALAVQGEGAENEE